MVVLCCSIWTEDEAIAVLQVLYIPWLKFLEIVYFFFVFGSLCRGRVEYGMYVEKV